VCAFFFDYISSFIWLSTFSLNMQVDVVKEGLVIPYGTFHNAKITGSVEIKIGEKEVIIKEKTSRDE